MRVSRTRFSKRRLKRKTEFPIVAVVKKKRKSPSMPVGTGGFATKASQSFSMFRKEKISEGSGVSSSQNKTRSTQDVESVESGRVKGSILSPNLKKNGDKQKPQKKSRALIDYKNIILLRNLITAEGKILPRRINKLTAKQQRSVQRAIKSARIMGLIPFINKTRPF